MPTTVDEVIERIASLELSNTRFSDISTSEIGQQNRVLYMNAIQKALVHLYSEFDLREGWFELLPIVGRVHYPITSAASMRNNPNTGYINDIGKKTVFDDAEVMTIYSCVTSKGVPVGINDVNDPFSVFIDKYNRIQIPNPIKEGSYLFTYRAYHPKVTGSTTAIADADVNALATAVRAVWDTKYPTVDANHEEMPMFTDSTLTTFGVATAENVVLGSYTYL